MAISILIADPSEIDQFISFGLDLAAKLDKSLAILCVAKSDEKKSTPQESPGGAEATRFSGRVGYAEKVEQSLASIQTGSQYKNIVTGVFEVPPSVGAIRDWLADPPHTETLGRFAIETFTIDAESFCGRLESMIKWGFPNSNRRERVSRCHIISPGNNNLAAACRRWRLRQPCPNRQRLCYSRCWLPSASSLDADRVSFSHSLCGDPRLA